MQKGFFSFVIGAIFLFALLSSATMLSSLQADYSYEKYRAAFVFEIALKNAFYSAISESAGRSTALAVATGAEPRALARTAIFHTAQEFERQLQLQGHDVVFWCGNPTEASVQQAALEMPLQKRALAPEGSLLLPNCADSLDINLLSKKIHLSNLGFSYYSSATGIGKAAVFPSSYEVDFQ